jgi:hypothetical protein
VYRCACCAGAEALGDEVGSAKIGMTASVIMPAIKTKIRFVISVCRAGASPAGWKSGKSDVGLAEAVAL